MAAKKKAKKTAVKKTAAPKLDLSKFVLRVDFDDLSFKTGEMIGGLAKQISLLEERLKSLEPQTPPDATGKDEKGYGHLAITAPVTPAELTPVSTEPTSAQTVESTPVTTSTPELKPVPVTEPISF